MSNQEQPDPSATTQQFRAFVRRGDAEAPNDSGSGRSGLAVGVIAVAVIALIAIAVVTYAML